MFSITPKHVCYFW